MYTLLSILDLSSDFQKPMALNIKNMKFILLIAFLATISLGQDSLQTRWIAEYGSPAWEEAVDIHRVDENHFIILGQFRELSNRDVWLAEIDSNGLALATNQFDLGGNEGVLCSQLIDGGSFIIGGYIEESLGADRYAWLANVNTAGDIIWSSTFFNAYILNSVADILQLGDGGYLITGSRNDSAFVSLIEPHGQEVWSKVYETGIYPAAKGIAIDTLMDGRIVVGINVYEGGGDYHYWAAGLLILDSQGEQISFSRVHCNAEGAWGRDPLMDLTVTASDKIILLGQTLHALDFHYEDAFLTCLNPDGEEEWVRTYGGEDSENPTAIQSDQNDNLVVVGSTQSFGSPNINNLWAFMTDSEGNEVWTYVHPSSNWEHARSFIILGEYDILLAGKSKKRMTTAEIQVLAARANHTTVSTAGFSYLLPSDFKISTYPNPTNGALTIDLTTPFASMCTISVYDVLGRRSTYVRSMTSVGLNRIRVEHSPNSTSGISIIRVEQNGFIRTAKILQIQ